MNRLKLLLAALALMLPLALFSCMPPIDSDVAQIPETSERSETSEKESQSPPAAPTFLYQTMTYEYKTDVSASIDFLTTKMSKDYLTLTNKSYPLGETYEPESLVSLTCPTSEDKSIYLDARAAKALYAMLEEMQADGVTDIKVTSGYRSYVYQQQLYQSYLKIEKSKITPEAYAYFGADYIKTTYTDKGLTQLSPEDATKVVLSYSAPAGMSEHQTGLCVDFVTSSNTGLTTAFENTEAFAWLSQNAYRFGFILRYPESKTAVTGYSYEPWHFRFVGREAATEIALRSLTLEEFLGAS